MNAVKRLTSGSSSATSPDKANLKNGKFPNQTQELNDLSPELVPIVTLISSQNHRRYYEGIFMLYYDLNGDGKPADREWKEVYGILTGNQLAYWDAANLAEFRNNPSALLENSSKPNYINFTDSVYNAMKVLPAAKQNLDNVIIVSTTLKNRYIIQFKSSNDLNKWYLALRLSNFEYLLLQLAYTGALLSARGSRLSDIKTILAEKRFDHEDWVSIRYGSGMAWKRCYAVVEPSTTKRHDKFIPGRILFYENDQKKKKQLMAVVTNCSSVAAVYPQSHLLIDHSTMLKLEGYINFKSPSLSTKVSKKSVDDFKNTSIFLMPEQHSSVPGFDTLIRFLIPLLDSFGLYGRPKRLKAERTDQNSLLFGLPTLPRVHYLELDDINSFSNSGDFLNWDIKAWTTNIKSVLKSKIDKGYDGCGSTRGFAGAINSLSSPLTPNSSSFPKTGSPQITQPSQNAALAQQRSASSNSVLHDPGYKNKNNLLIEPTNDPHKSVELSDIYQKYSDLKSPSDQFNMSRNEILNGSHEELMEDDLPAAVRKISLSENMYPKDDHELFSESDEDDDESSSSEKIDSRQLGFNSPNAANLIVPPYNNRNSSYSSVQSPMTQYQDFNEKFAATVTPTSQRAPQELTFSDDEPESPPPVPSHQVSSPYKNNNSSHPRIQKPNYITSPNMSQNQFVSSNDELTGYRQETPSAPPVIAAPMGQQSSRANQPNQMNRTMSPKMGNQMPPPMGQQRPQQQLQQPLGSSVYSNQKISGSTGQFSSEPQQRPRQQQPMQQSQPPQQYQQVQQPQQYQKMHQPQQYQQVQQPVRQVPQQQQPQHQQQQQHQQHRRPQNNQTYHNYNAGVPPPMNTGVPPPMNTGVPPPMNTGIPPSTSFNSRPQNNQMGQMGQMGQGQMGNQRQYNNMRNYGNVPYQQYQYQPQQQVRPQGSGQQQAPPPPQSQSQSQRQNPNPYTRQY